METSLAELVYARVILLIKGWKLMKSDGQPYATKMVEDILDELESLIPESSIPGET